MIQLKTGIYVVTISSILTLLFNQSSKIDIKKNTNLNLGIEQNSTYQNRDEKELTKLIRLVYKWHVKMNLEDFPYKYDEKQDGIFIGIDWVKYQRNMELFRQTDFFSRGFYQQHKNIALSLDSSIKKADIYFRNYNDGIPIWATGADEWCNCQDYIENYWETLTIDSLIIKNEHAEFKWAWDNESEPFYKVKAIKENNKWKINTLQGFSNYHTVEYYDRIMDN